MKAPDILPAVRASIASLRALQLRAGILFREAGMAAVADNPPTPTEVFEEALASNLLHVALIDGETAGFTLGIERDEGSHLEQVSVDPRFSRRGVGSSLVAHFIASSRANGYTYVSLSTFSDVAWNAPFFARFGFTGLPAESMTPFLRDLRDNERRLGLAMDARIIMILDLAPSKTRG